MKKQATPTPTAPARVPTIGRMVIYTLTEDDAASINRRRTDGFSIAERLAGERWPAGAQAHIGNTVAVGEQYPMLIVRHWEGDMVNGQVFLDGNDVYWATSAHQGAAPKEGHWHWPEIVPNQR